MGPHLRLGHSLVELPPNQAVPGVLCPQSTQVVKLIQGYNIPSFVSQLCYGAALGSS